MTIYSFMLIFVVCINLLPSDFTLSKLEKISMNSPVLIKFNLNKFNVSESWTEFSSLHRENTSINCALIYCTRYNEICQRFSITDPSTYLTIYRKYYQMYKITDDSIEELNDLYMKSFTDPLPYCHNYFLPSDNNITFQYPTFVLKYIDISACLDLSKYKLMYPDATFYLQKAEKTYNNIYMKIDLCYSPSSCVQNIRFYDTSTFIDEFLHDHFGNWTLNDVFNIKRRLALIVYDDIENDSNNLSDLVKNRPKRSDFEKYINLYSIYFLFGLLPFSSFQASVGQLRLQSECPFMLITNTKKTRFMIVDYSRLNFNQISDKLNSARQGFYELQMDYFFDSKYAMEHLYNPKNMIKFAIAAFCVVGLTALMILWKAYFCINMYDNYKYTNSISI